MYCPAFLEGKCLMEAKNKMVHVDILDGLRGIAIIMVVFFHVWQLSWLDISQNVFGFRLKFDVIPRAGYMGVELFFFISGFCLFYPYARHMFENLPLQTVKKYAYKRAIKILPSYFLAVILITVFFEHNYTNLNEALKHILSHVFFVHNLFQDTYYSINGVFWSLGVEVQFYILFPLICWLFRKQPVITYIAVCAFSYAFRMYIKNLNDFHFLLNQLPGFLDMFINGMMGAYLFMLIKNRVKNYQILKPFLTVFSILMFSSMFLMLDWLSNVGDDNHIKLWQADNRLYMGLIFLVLTVSAALSNTVWQKILGNKVLVFFSVISYNLYIWHQFIARLLYEKYKFPMPKTTDPHSDPQWQLTYSIVAILVGIAVSALITYGFERPLLKNGVKGTMAKLAGVFSKQQKNKAIKA